jgi:hypothetical protein
LISKTTERFRKSFARLSPEMQSQARESYRTFQRDPNHNSLQFKPTKKNPAVWSVRVSLGYRALGWRSGDKMVWFWIGTRNDFERVVAEL